MATIELKLTATLDEADPDLVDYLRDIGRTLADITPADILQILNESECVLVDCTVTR